MKKLLIALLLVTLMLPYAAIAQTQGDSQLTIAVNGTEAYFPIIEHLNAALAENGVAVNKLERANDIILLNEFENETAAYQLITMPQGGRLPVGLLLDSGVITGLAADSEAAQHLGGYISFQDAMTRDGSVLGIPFFAVPYAFSVNAELAAEIGIELPDAGWTWDNFFAMAQAVYDYNEENGTQHALLGEQGFSFDYPLMQYMFNNIDFDSAGAKFSDDAFAALLTQWKEWFDKGVIADNDKSAVFVPGSILDIFFAGNYVYPPVMDEDTRYPVNIMYMALSGKASGEGAAADYLAGMLAPENAPFNELGIQALEGEITLEQLKAREENEMFPLDEITQQGFDLWRGLFEKGVFAHYNTTFTIQFTLNILPQFMAGEKTIDETLAAADELLERVINQPVQESADYYGG